MPRWDKSISRLQGVELHIRVVLVRTFVESWKVAFVHDGERSRDSLSIYKRLCPHQFIGTRTALVVAMNTKTRHSHSQISQCTL
jgi:hypothetical protein